MASPAIAEGPPDPAAGGSSGGIPTRKEKRKALKKLKRKQVRREAAILKREAEESRSNDPDEQLRIRLMEEAETEAAERDRRAFEERERHWLEAAAAKKAEEAAATKKAEEDSQRETIPEENELEGGDDWEYVEEGPAEIIWQGNEIIVKKKRVKVPKRNADRKPTKEDVDRPTSNPLPPQSTVFSSYKNCESAQEALEGVAKQIPNFGTEQDKAHCPFHLKTGACRFGSRCSRVHFYPDKSGTLLIKNMYNGPGLAWDQDEGLECTDEEIEHCYEEFYEDVHTEFLKFGELVNFKVCKNGSFHLRGNVYVHYMSLESAVLAYNAMNGRFFAGKQIICEFVGVTKWKVAICGEYMKSRLRTCSHGSACNFIHCFHNPGGDYEWADWDNPPPKYWIKKMNALFGPTVESLYDKQLNLEGCERPRDSSRRSTPMNYRRQSRRCTHDEMDMHRSGSGRDDSDGKRDRPRREESSRRRKRSDYLDRYEPNEEKYKFDVHNRDSVEDRPEEQDRYSIKKRQKCEVENHERHVRKHRTEEDSSRWKVGEHGKRHGSSYRVPDDSGAERSDNTREQYEAYCSDGFDHDKNLRENTSEVSELRSKRRESDKYNSQDCRDDASRDHGRTGKKARSRKSKSTDRLFSSDESNDHQKDADAECDYEETHHHRLVDESSKSGRKGKRHRKKEEFNETEEPSKDSDYDYIEPESRESKKHSRSRTPLCRSESSRRERDQQLC